MPEYSPVTRNANRGQRHCPVQNRVKPGNALCEGRTKCLRVIGSALLMSTLLPATSGQETPTAADNPSDRYAALETEIRRLSASDADSSDTRQLIAIDAELKDRKGEVAERLQQSVLVALAELGTASALEHLRSVFETQTHRRHDAAHAISIAALVRPTDDQDWRYLVRSLTIVERDQAVSVLKALRRFRRRATKPSWVRQVILIGLTLPEQDHPAALELLKFWTQHTPSPQASLNKPLADYQAWFRRTFPNEPNPQLPVDAPGSRWTYDRLSDVIADSESDQTSPAAGEVVYSKADCKKCHRRGDMKGQPQNDQLGPDLTSLSWRRQPKEILTAILYPSHHLNDEYPVTTVVLQNGKTVSGLMVPDEDGGLKIVSSDNRTTRFKRTDIDETLASNVSNMPAGLLEPLSRREIKQLMAFLTAGAGDADPHGTLSAK
jgi:putative heme-binding domain-containing protein